MCFVLNKNILDGRLMDLQSFRKSVVYLNFMSIVSVSLMYRVGFRLVLYHLKYPVNTSKYVIKTVVILVILYKCEYTKSYTRIIYNVFQYNQNL